MLGRFDACHVGSPDLLEQPSRLSPGIQLVSAPSPEGFVYEPSSDLTTTEQNSAENITASSTINLSP